MSNRRNRVKYRAAHAGSSHDKSPQEMRKIQAVHREHAGRNYRYEKDSPFASGESRDPERPLSDNVVSSRDKPRPVNTMTKKQRKRWRKTRKRR